MNIIYHLDTAIKTLLSIEPKQCDSYVDSEIKYYINELKNIRTYAECFGNEDEKLEFLHNGVKFDPVGKPEHYNKGEIDLFEAAYRTRPFNETRAILEFVAERYTKRHKENRIEDLDKAIATLERLREYELKELE